jgi:NAD(P)-dependent dehydrogenase (short-subunit alcohol dehydrogenase family)
MWACSFSANCPVDGEISKKETAVKVVEAAPNISTDFDRIDLLVNNAGIFIPKAFTGYTEEDCNLVMNTNVASFFFRTQQVIPQMRKRWPFTLPKGVKREDSIWEHFLSTGMDLAHLKVVLQPFGDCPRLHSDGEFAILRDPTFSASVR